MELLAAAGIGFLLGIQHALDPDHLVAVSTIVSRTKRMGASLLLGGLWGLGHSATVFAVGALIIAFKVVIAPRLALGMEFLVGVMLVVLGASNLLQRRLETRHSHAHVHEGSHGHHAGRRERHSHDHRHFPAIERLAEAAGQAGRPAMLRAFAVGTVHGLAGSAAAALLVLAAIPTVGGGLVYLGVFGLGTLAGMILFSGLMEASFLWASRSLPSAGLRAATGLASALFGFYLIYRTGFVEGLLFGSAAVPH